MDVLYEVLKTKEIGFVKFGEPDFTQLTGLALVFIAIALISVFTIKEAQDQRKQNETTSTGEETTTFTANVAAPAAAPAEPQVTSPQSVKKTSRARTPSRGRTPKKEAAPKEDDEDDRAKTPSKKRATSNRRGRQSEAAESVASPEVSRSSRARQAKTPKA